MVTHNIEEAVLMCDRILVFTSEPRPGRERSCGCAPHPRNRLDPAFRQLVDDIYGLMTRRPVSRRAPPPATIAVPLQRVGTNQMAGLMEALAGPPYTCADLPALSRCAAIRGWTNVCAVGETLNCRTSRCWRKATSR